MGQTVTHKKKQKKQKKQKTKNTPPRYFKQYDAVVEMRRGAISFHQTIRTLFDDDKFPGAKEVRMKLHRYCLALFYCTFGWFPHYQQHGLNIWVFNHMCELGLLSPEEQAELLSLSKTSKPHQWVRCLAVFARAAPFCSARDAETSGVM
jgi:hypothetical protein